MSLIICLNGEKCDLTNVNVEKIVVHKSFNRNVVITGFSETLHSFDVGLNVIGGIKCLPSSLRFLDCMETRIKELPELNYGLEVLFCGSNRLEALPDLPDTLVHIYCEYNNIRCLPKLSKNLKTMGFSVNKMQEFPESFEFPESLESLFLDNNGLSWVPSFPDSLKIVDISCNRIEEIPQLPKTLESLNIYGNKVKVLSRLPRSLVYICAEDNDISEFPDFTENLTEVRIENNPLVNLPKVNKRLVKLNVDTTLAGRRFKINSTAKYSKLNIAFNSVPVLLKNRGLSRLPLDLIRVLYADFLGVFRSLETLRDGN